MHNEDERLTARVRHANQQALAEGRLVGSVVLVARAGALVCAEACGDADRERQQAMQLTTQFRLASVSKPFTTLAAMRMIEQQKLALSDTVSQWLPWFTPALPDGRRPAITIRQLLTHTAGLDYRFHQPPDGPYHALGVEDGLGPSSLSLEQNLRRLSSAPLLAEPGQMFNYSLAIDVLGAVLERVTGLPLPQVFEQWVAQPLGLRNTGFSTENAANLATAYYNSATGPQLMYDGIKLPIPPDFDCIVEFAPSRALDAAAYPSGGGGMVGCAQDVLALLEAMRTGDNVLRPETAELMRQPHVGPEAEVMGPGWGFGFGGALLADAQLAATPQHNGTLQWGGVYGSSWFIDPVAQLSVVALTNTAYEGMNGQYTLQIRDAVYGVNPG
ncbi:CubicO group peptidase (beta-lactamase class C family) [Gibbsiella quercinecans]|uniref:Serine hydrolase n=1 Tax=Gibbsiella quercinecans TaxID=929813 RepID=A0A250B7F1_9GAMM|nr:serine hydrolase domain-containing protein [Gibbsiella quercinecans]ATA22047.1 serine hydrolase [Gibbsiella quercinecans]RLM05716.1 serine hydrolase [Gibbsiella quercinecans]RLM06637.1 serine hydrolase [Gibbsiella quercinecans]TCT87931.1 CubicO group peptidase (beta-lactamase class C family) [Gibbsiella quercinecans]